MHRTFNSFNQIFDLLIARSQTKVHRNWGNHKSLSGLRIAAGSQPPAEQIVHSALERAPGAPYLFLHKASYIIVESKGSSHIVMLHNKTSRCQPRINA